MLPSSPYTDKKENKFSSYIRRFRRIGVGAKSYMTNDLLIYGENICAFPHILGSPFSYMTLHPIPSEFPYRCYIWWKILFSFLSVYCCTNSRKFDEIKVKNSIFFIKKCSIIVLKIWFIFNPKPLRKNNFGGNAFSPSLKARVPSNPQENNYTSIMLSQIFPNIYRDYWKNATLMSARHAGGLLICWYSADLQPTHSFFLLFAQKQNLSTELFYTCLFSVNSGLYTILL